MTKTARIHVARPGTFTDAHGRTVTMDAARISALAESYDVANKAPLVLGHPRMDAPAYGWVDELEVGDDGGLYARVSDVAPDLADAVSKGRYRNVSISWYPKGHQNSPKAETDVLRHVGILGAAVPAIRGLEPLKFSGDEDGVVAIEFNDRAWQGWWALKQGLRSMRDWFVEREGVETANRVVPDYLIDALDGAVDGARDADPDPAFTDPPQKEEPPVPPEEKKPEPPVDLAGRTAELDRREAEIKAREDRIAADEAKAREAASVAFADGLVSDGRLAPAARDIIAEAHRRLAGDNAPISFSDGASRPPLEEFEKLFAGAKPVIDLAERSATDASTLDESGPGALEKRARAIVKEDPAISFADAVRMAEGEFAEAAA